MGESKAFGEWLRHRRRELDLTQAELAQQVGCAPITVRKIEADQMRPSKQLALLLIERLGIAEDEREDFVRFARGGEAAKSITVVEPRDNLPHPISSFIGRERDIAEVKRLLSISRLVTLTGAGGCGKSRLAIETARQMLDIFPDGVWFAAFAPLSDPTLVHPTIASALRVRENPGQSLIETLSTYLHSRDLLLVFDNCEHLIAECAQAADTLLQACPRLHILATSREPLNIMGEEQYYVPCLSLPVEAEGAPVERLNQSEAMRLFVDRGALVNSTFALTAENSPVIAEICRRLDGMPLAIELAAARVKALTVQHIAERLDDRFNLLTAGNRMALPRHQTLRAAIDWSYELLPQRAQVLFRRLSVFAGGFTPEAAQSICSSDGLAADDVLEELSRLVDRSLVEVVRGERYRLLETVRQYARERLRESGQETPVRERHLEYFMSWAEEVEPKLRGPEQLVWWDRIETEHDNIRAALDWSLTDGDPQVGLRLAVSAYWFWYPRNYWREGRKWVTALLERIPDELWTPARAKASPVAVALTLDWSPIDASLDDYNGCLKYWQEAGDDWWSAFALTMLGWRLIIASDPVSARRHLEEAVAFARKTKDDWILGYSLRVLGAAVQRIDIASSRSILEEGLRHLRATGDRWALAEGLNQLIAVPMSQADYAGAAALAEEALGIYREMQDRGLIAGPLWDLMYAMLALENVDRAAELAREGLQLARSLGYLSYIAFGVMGHGYVAAARGSFHRSAILLSASEALLNSVGISEFSYPVWQSFYERSLANARAQLGESEFNKTLAEGRAMTVKQAVAYALEGLEEG